jgi:hypothetical protein
VSAVGARRLVSLVAAMLVGATPAAGQSESVQARLLRTVQIGVAQDIAPEELDRLATDGGGDYSTTLLARSALLVLRRSDAGLIPYDELLDGALNHMVRDGNGFPAPPGLPGFGAKETVLAMVYAMVMGGQQERVVEVLAKHRFTGSKYKQEVVLSALRNVGTQRAKDLIQEYAEKGQDPNVAEATLADEDFPVLAEVFERWNLVPPSARVRRELLATVRSGCGERPAMAAYWLGFFAPSPDAEQEGAELDALRTMIRATSAGCNFMDHIIAMKSLALRSPETIADWTALARGAANVWERHQAVICAFGRWGRKFAPSALDLLKTEPAQYVQWELMNGNLTTRRDGPYRTRWDVWLPVNILVAIEDVPTGPDTIGAADLNELLAWLESGARPQDPAVGNHLLYQLAGSVRGDDTRRWLRVFTNRPDLAQSWWILADLRDPTALPILRYWSTLPTSKDQAEILSSVIDTLAKTAAPGRAQATACCRPTEACLVTQATRAGAPAPVTIGSEDEAAKWLASGSAPEPGVAVHFTDPSNRIALVRDGDGAEQRWQYVYDCWRRVDGASGGATR